MSACEITLLIYFTINTVASNNNEAQCILVIYNVININMPVQCLVHQKATEIAQKVYNNWQWQYSTEIIYTTAMHVKRTDI